MAPSHPTVPGGLAIVTDTWDSQGGGREQYVAEAARALAVRGWTVDVLTNRIPRRPQVTSGVALHRVGGPRLRGVRALRRAAERYRLAHPDRPVLATRMMPGATHCQLHSGLYVDAFAAERASFDSRLRRWCFWPGVRVNGWRRQLLRDEARTLSCDGAAAIMTFSKAMGDEVCRRFVTPRARVTVLPLGIDLGEFHPSPRATPPAGVVRLLFAGHNFRLKGLGPALAALALVRARGVDARLTIAGADSIASARRAARRVGVDSAIAWAGALPPGAMPALYRGSHLLIHPTFFDPFPRVVLEALASGCPVVTTSCCGVATYITGREGFVLSSARDIGGLSDAIVAASEPDRWTAMSDAAARLGAQFDFDRHIDALIEWLGLGEDAGSARA